MLRLWEPFRKQQDVPTLKFFIFFSYNSNVEVGKDQAIRVLGKLTGRPLPASLGGTGGGDESELKELNSIHCTLAKEYQGSVGIFLAFFLRI